MMLSIIETNNPTCRLESLMLHEKQIKGFCAELQILVCMNPLHHTNATLVPAHAKLSVTTINYRMGYEISLRENEAVKKRQRQEKSNAL